jgi:hypothetical protein
MTVLMSVSQVAGIIGKYYLNTPDLIQSTQLQDRYCYLHFRGVDSQHEISFFFFFFLQNQDLGSALYVSKDQPLDFEMRNHQKE